ncbi:unnamed protein product, partial [Chrysoparadoxa australica]
VRFQVTATNASPASTDPITIESLVDPNTVGGPLSLTENAPGSIQGTTCASILGSQAVTFAPGQTETCTYERYVEGGPFDPVSQAVQIAALDDDKRVVPDDLVYDQDGVAVQLANVLPMVSVSLAPFPEQVSESWGIVRYVVMIENNGEVLEDLTVTSLTD